MAPTETGTNTSLFVSTASSCWGCGGPLGNCACVAEAMRLIREAAQADRAIRTAVARCRVPLPRRRREPPRTLRRPERSVPVASYATSMRHYAGR